MLQRNRKNRSPAKDQDWRNRWQDFSNNLANEPFGVLSLGSHTTRVAIFCRDKKNLPLLMGFALVPSLGVKKGFIVDIQACCERAVAALSQAERMAGHNVTTMAVLLAGAPPAVVLRQDHITIGGAAVGRRHLRALNQKFWSPKTVDGYNLLYPIPYDYQLDGADSIKNPLGLVGQRLDLIMAMIYEKATALDNINHFLKKMNLTPSWLIDEALAAALGMTTIEEQELGALAIHIGAETTNIAVIKNFCPVVLDRLPLGGRGLTEALAKNLGLDMQQAEAVKRSLPAMTAPLTDDGGGATRGSPLRPAIDQGAAGAVVRGYLSNLFDQVAAVLEKNNIHYRQLAVVSLSGGGAKVKGLAPLLKEKWGRRVRQTPATLLPNLPSHVDGIEIASLSGAARFIIKKQLGEQQGREQMGNFYKTGPQPWGLGKIVAWLKKNYG